MPSFVFLWTDFVLWLVVLGVAVYAWRVRGNRHALATWRHVTHDAPAMAAALIVDRPMPPAPNTATVLPGSTRAVRATAP